MLKSVKTSKAAGPDNVPAHMIKDAYKELACPLYHLINESIKAGIFPTAKKVAKVTPVYKSEAYSLFDNYCPVSVLNILFKIMEKSNCSGNYNISWKKWTAIQTSIRF